MPPANPNSITSIIQSIDPDEYSTLFREPASPPARHSPPLEDNTNRRLRPFDLAFDRHNGHWVPRTRAAGYTRPPPQPRGRSRAEIIEEANRRRTLPRVDFEALRVREREATPETSTSTSSRVSQDTTAESPDSQDEQLGHLGIRIHLGQRRRPGVLPERNNLSHTALESPERLGLDTATPATAMPTRRSASITAVNGATATSSRSSRRRTAAQAFGDEGSEADHEENINPVAGPRRKRRNDTNTNGQASSPQTNEPIVIDDLDDEVEAGGEDTTAQRLQETLQKQREEAVKSQQAASEMPKLSKLQCVICMDSFTDMTATSCGHIFCHECLISALRASENRRFAATGVHGKRSQCPVCRTSLSRSKAGDLIPLLIMKKGMATQPRRARAG